MSDYEYEEKIVFLGESDVGKSSIILRFTRGTFDHNVYSALAGKYVTKTIEIPELGKSLNVDIWGTIGQEKYRALNKIFYKDAKMVILVYDITRKDSFDELKNYWYYQLKQYGDPNVVIGIAGNKCDLYDREEVPEQEAREFAKSIGAVFSLTSAQNNTGINELFKKLAKKFLNQTYQIIEPDEENQMQNLEKNQEQKQESKKRFKILLKYLSF